tara:strand:+ start:2027 stop:2662 length:636 start_codon:yes stop_codon:yes gene_type:complete
MKQIRYFIFSILVCGFTYLQSQTTHDVTIAGFAFSPSDLSIEVGDVVHWTNQDNFDHSVRSRSEDGSIDESGPLQSDLFGNGGTWDFTFDQMGSFPYRCGPHSNMTGNITVEQSAGIKSNSVYAKTFNLYPVYPNPFNPSATISWEQPTAENVHISIFNLQGQLSDEFSFTKSQPGSHTFDWHPGGLPTGVYLICLTGETFTVTQRAVYLK